MAIDPDSPYKSLQECHDSDSPYKSLQECHDSGIITNSNEEMKRRVKSLSCGLAEIREHHHTEIVQFIHQSVNDFLVDDGLKVLLGNSWQSMSLAIGSAHHQLSRSCIRYIDMKEIRQWESEGWDERTKFPFLVYAIKSWLPHAEIAHSKGISVADLLDCFHWPSNNLIGLWVKTYRMLDPFSGSCPPEGTTLIHIVARHGLIEPLSAALEHLPQLIQPEGSSRPT